MADRLETIQVLFTKRNARRRGPTSSYQYNDSIEEIAHDFSALNEQWNNRLVPLTDGLPDGSEGLVASSVDAFTNGLDARTLFVNHDATASVDSEYYKVSAERPTTVYEQIVDIYSTISTLEEDLEDQINNKILTAQEISITDSGGLYTAENVEAALAEVMTQVEAISISSSSVLDLSAVDQHYLPETDNLYDIGSTSKRIRSLYVTGSSVYVQSKTTDTGSPPNKDFSFSINTTTGKLQIKDDTTVVAEFDASTGASFPAGGGGSGSPGGTWTGTVGQVQFNNNGNFAGAAELWVRPDNGNIGIGDFSSNTINYSLHIRTDSSGGNAVVNQNAGTGTLSNAFFQATTGAGSLLLRMCGENFTGIDQLGETQAGRGILATDSACSAGLRIGTEHASAPLKLGAGGGLHMTLQVNGDLDMDHGLKVGSANTAEAGRIEWDGSNFRGHTGSGWVNLDASSGTPAGSDGQVQYNNGGAFGGAAQLYYDDANNHVGIGTASPLVRLHVVDTVASEAALRVQNDGNNANRYGMEIWAGLDTPSSNDDCRWIDLADGNGTVIAWIGYDSAGPSAAFHTTSDARLKNNIKPVEFDALSAINGLEICSFDWKDSSKPHVEKGFVAQQVEQFIPEMVGEDAEGIKSVSEGPLVKYLVKAVQELSTRIEQLEIELEEAKNGRRN